MRAPAVAVSLALLLVLAGCGGGGGANEGERTKAIAAARAAYGRALRSGSDLSAGPCIAERLPGISDWVADIAHDPREDVDDDPANQCARYRSGAAPHFVELTPEGRLIRAE